MLGKRFQRTISMSQMGPGSNGLHTEKVQVQQPHQQQQQQQQHAECGQSAQPPWQLLKNAEAVVMMMMANSSGAAANAAAATVGGEHGLYPCTSSTPSPSTEQQPAGSPSSLILSTHHFLDACFLCKRRLRPERDIFIYRGDAAFCTEECRNRQILTDEMRSSRASKQGGDAASKMAVVA